MEVTIRQLRAFMEVAKSRNFRASSANLGMSQPTLSTLIQNLEYGLGAPLFIRTTRRVSLTEEGARMLTIAEGLVHNFDMIIANARRNIKDRGSRVAIAISVSSIIPLIFPRVLRELSMTHPHIKVRLISGLSRDMVELVSLGDADLGIVSMMPASDRFSGQKLFSDRLVVIGRAEDPVMQDPLPMDWGTLARQQFVAWNSGGGMREIIDSAPQLAAVMSRCIYEASNWSALRGFLTEGLGLAVVPWIIAHQESSSGLVYRELPEPVAGREVYIIERRNIPRSGVAEIVATIIARHVAEQTNDLPNQ